MGRDTSRCIDPCLYMFLSIELFIYLSLTLCLSLSSRDRIAQLHLKRYGDNAIISQENVNVHWFLFFEATTPIATDARFNTRGNLSS